MLVFYCNWGLRKSGGIYYAAAVHNIYLKKAKELFGHVILISKVKDSDESGVPQAYEVVEADEVWELPWFDSYLGAGLKAKQILPALKAYARRSQGWPAYVRNPEPFAHLFSAWRGRRARTMAHYASNPLKAIISERSEPYGKRLVKLALYGPEFLSSYFVNQLTATVTCNGEGLRQEFRKFGLGRMRVLNESTISNEQRKTRNASSFSPANAPLRIVYIGYLRPAKGVDDALSALAELSKLGGVYRFEIYGSGAEVYENRLRECAADLGIDQSVKFLGEVPHRVIFSQILPQADVLILPSYTEGSPRVVIEAMAQSVPVLASDVGNTRYLVGNKDLIFSPGDSKRLADLLMQHFRRGEFEKASLGAQMYSRSDMLTLEKFFEDVAGIIA